MNFWLSTYKVDGFVIVDADRLLEGPITTSLGRKRRVSLHSDLSNCTHLRGVSCCFLGSVVQIII